MAVGIPPGTRLGLAVVERLKHQGTIRVFAREVLAADFVLQLVFAGFLVLLAFWYVSTGEATPSILLKPPPEDKPVTKDPGTQMLEEVDEPPGNETPMLFELAMPGPKNELPADDARLEDEPKNSPIQVIATRARSNRSVRAKTGMPSGMGPGKGKLGFFGQGGTASGVVFVLDKSWSMGSEDGRLKFSKDELKKTLGKMPNWMRFGVIYFSHPASEPPGFVDFSRALVFATDNQKQRAYSFIDAIEPLGSTNPYPALKLAVSYNDTDLIYLLSDGFFFMSESELREIIQACKKNKIKINAISFKDPGGEAMLKRLSGETGGKYKFAP